MGGIEEVGENMTVLEYGDDLIVIDMGLAFPDDTMPGIDYIIPDTKWLEENKRRVRGVVITHGHLDHIGAVPYILPKLGDPPVYTMALTAGFTSLASLGKLAVGEVKLDRSFLTTIDRDPKSRALIEATISLAHALGLQVVAEGVEEAATLATLASLGCDLAQGYYIAKPASAAQLNLGQHLVA